MHHKMFLRNPINRMPTIIITTTIVITILIIVTIVITIILILN